MANPFSVTINQLVTDGTNIYVTASIFDGLHTNPPIQVSFPSGTSAATINNYFQTVANNQPVLTGALAALTTTTLQGV